ncbi:hypothetical protein ACF08M_35340 [Streptomyces sp. NPDC015032]|uniref:hypothetical protein n=1 Tax=Streptomyces sp. NPDC015032 TaxID=3364937 RepID=UPI0036FA7A71
MNSQLAADLLTLAVAFRVFGRDAVALLRRIAVAGVKAGVSEISRCDVERDVW